jgi:hypothetical protein
MKQRIWGILISLVFLNLLSACTESLSAETVNKTSFLTEASASIDIFGSIFAQAECDISWRARALNLGFGLGSLYNFDYSSFYPYLKGTASIGWFHVGLGLSTWIIPHIDRESFLGMGEIGSRIPIINLVHGRFGIDISATALFAFPSSFLGKDFDLSADGSSEYLYGLVAENGPFLIYSLPKLSIGIFYEM